MKSGSLRNLSKPGTTETTARRGAVRTSRQGTKKLPATRGDLSMESEARFGRLEEVAAHPLAELLDCPAEAGRLLNGSTESLQFDGGEPVFLQGSTCRGLYVVISGTFLRRAERLQSRLTLGPARSGDLVELAAALGDGLHTYTLSAQEPGSLLLLPMDALNRAFESYPPLRMRLLEELAREVSRGYITSCLSRGGRQRRRGDAPMPA